MSSDFELTRNEIIQTAYEDLGILGEGQTLSSDRMAFGVKKLNALIKTYQEHGLHLWAEEEGYVFLDKGVGTYNLGNRASSPAKACYREDAVLTTLTTTAAAAATALTVGTTTGMTVGDYFGIVLDTTYIYWTTIATIPTSTTLTITTGLPSQVSGNKNIYTFTTLISKPMRMYSTRRLNDTNTERAASFPMYPATHDEFFDITFKQQQGAPSQWYYQPRKTYGQLNLWPIPESAANFMEVTFDRALEDMDTLTDIPDFPSEWIEVLTYQLAIRLAPRYGKEAKVAQLIAPQGMALLQQALDWDSEIGSMYLQPQTHRYN